MRLSTIDVEVAVRTKKAPSGSHDVLGIISRDLAEQIGEAVAGRGVVVDCKVVSTYAPETLSGVGASAEDANRVAFAGDRGLVIRTV